MEGGLHNGWQVDRMERRSRGERLSFWPEAMISVLIASPAIVFALGVLIVAGAIWRG